MTNLTNLVYRPRSDRPVNVFARVLDDELHGFRAFVCDESDVSRFSPDFSDLGKHLRDRRLLL